MAFSWRTTAFMSCALTCGGGWRGGQGGQLFPDIAWCASQGCCAPYMGTGCLVVHTYRRQSPINSCTTSSPTLGSTELPKMFEVLRLDKEVSSEESSGGPLPNSGRAVEKAMKVSRAAENLRFTDPISTEETCQIEHEKAETATGEGARGSRHMAGARVNGLWFVNVSAHGRDASAVLNIDKNSCLLLGRSEVSVDVEASNTEKVDSLDENIHFSRIGGGDGLYIEDIDDNHYQDARAAVTNSASKYDFWPAIEVEEVLAKGQCPAFDQWQPYQSVMKDPEKRGDDMHFNGCIHHLLAVLSRPRVTTIDKEPMSCGQEQMMGSRRGVHMSLEANLDDENNGVVSMTSRSDDVYLHKPFLQLWNGFWVGPDDVDGWGFVEALVSPVDIDGPFFLSDLTE